MTLSALAGPFGAVLAIVMATYLVRLPDGHRFTRQWTEVLGALAVVVGGIGVVTLSTTVVLHRSALASGDLAVPGDSLDVPPVAGPVSMQWHARPPNNEVDRTAAADFTLAILEGDRIVAHHTAHVEGGGRDQRMRLPGDRVGQVRRVRLENRRGTLDSPLHLDVVLGPPSPWAVAGIGLLLLALAAFVDAHEHGKTSVSIKTAFLVGFALAIPQTLTPSSSITAFVPVVMAALVGGYTMGSWCRAVVTAMVFAAHRAPTQISSVG